MELACLIIRGAPRLPEESKYPEVLCALAGRPFGRARGALLYPSFRRVRIKQVSFVSKERAVVALKGTPQRNLVDGSLLIADGQGVYASRVGYGLSAEAIPPGTYRLEGGAYRGHSMPGTATITPIPGGYRLNASADLPMVPGMRYRLSPAGGAGRYELLLCFPFEAEPRARSQVSGALRRLSAASERRALYRELFHLAGWVCLPADFSAPILQGDPGTAAAGPVVRVTVRRGAVPAQGAVKGTAGERSSASGTLVEGTAEKGGAAKKRVAGRTAATDGPAKRAAVEGRGAKDGEVGEVVGPDGSHFLISTPLFDRLRSEIEAFARRAGGPTIGLLARRLRLPDELLEAVEGVMAAEGRVEKREGFVVPADGRVALTPLEQGLSERLRSAPADRPLLRSRIPKEAVMLDKLARLGIAVRIANRYCHRERFEAMVGAIVSGRNPGDSVTLQEIQHLTRIPRDIVTDLIILLEGRGVLRRDGGIRRIVRGLEHRGRA
ncbi:MAG TPA: hypothetical protein VMV68_10715 [Spirochaetia bacterium]|nr:hypothetical protein [Spirochaetia bacterium]